LRSKKLPDYRLKQKILFLDKTSSESLIDYGNLCLEEGSHTDALDFYAAAHHTEGIEKISQFALSHGDAFLFQQASRVLGTAVQDTDWDKLAKKALELKKFSFARQAVEKITDTQLAGRLKQAIEAEETKQVNDQKRLL